MSKKLIAFALAGLFAFSAGSFKADAISDGIVCFNIDLKQGMTSPEVSTLQTELKSDPTVYPEGLVTGYFGPLTLKAVKAFQAKYGIITTGYVGPLTRGKLTELYCPVTTGLPAGCTSAVGFSPTTGDPCSGTPVTYPAGCTSAVGFSPTTGDPCAGTTTTTVGPTEGYFTFKQLASPANATSAKEGTTNTAVLAFTLKANNSDISLKTIKLGFDNRPWRYISKISLYDGTNLLREVAAVSSAFEEVTVGTSYNLYLSSLDIPILKGETKTFTFKVDVPASPETSGIVTLTLATNAIRGVDTIGLNVYAAAGETRTFTTAAGTTGALELSINAGAITDKVELISETDTTEHVTLAKFDLKAKYNDIHITEINNVTFVKNSSNTLDVIILAAELWDGDTILDSVTPATSGTIADFTDLDIDIVKDATKTLTIKASVAAIGASATKEGDYTNVTLAASVTNIVCEDSLYNKITATGSLTGKDVHFYTVAPVLSLTSVTGAKTNPDTGASVYDGVIKFSVTANGGTIYVNAMNVASSTYTGIFGTDSNATAASSSYTFISSADETAAASPVGAYYTIPSSETRSFTVSTHASGAGAFTYFSLSNLYWTSVSANKGTVTTTLDDLDWGWENYKTDSTYLEAS